LIGSGSPGRPLQHTQRFPWSGKRAAPQREAKEKSGKNQQHKS
jgi:hypothetical protein